MNKQQRKVITDEINRIIAKCEWREDKINNPATPPEKISLYEKNIEKDLAKLEGIDFVLNYLKYRKRYDPDTNKMYLEKWTEYGYRRVD